MNLKNIFKKFSPLIDFILTFLIIPSAFILKFYRIYGSKRLKISSNLLKKIGVMPVINHYYEPFYDFKNFKNEERLLPGINLNVEDQLKLIKNFTFENEFIKFVEEQKILSSPDSFKINSSENGSFESGDAEFLYQYIRFLKPKKVIEIGCGQSTKIISRAMEANKNDNQIDYKHICIEPYEMSWLSSFKNIEYIKKKVEDIDLNWNKELCNNDLLFIDSSHMIRPEGDVLYEFLTIIPLLNSGVHVHVHDIFTPNNYIDQFLKDEIKFWNEQYILEATLSNNNSYTITASLNYLKNNHFDLIKRICPFINEDRAPGSFYFKVN